MHINKLQLEDYNRWNEFVMSSPQGSIFSYTWYLDALNINYKILVLSENNVIKSGILLTKNEINTYSNPMLDKYLGILFCEENSNQFKTISKQYKYMDSLLTELKKIKSFDYSFHPSFKNWIPFYWNGFNQQTRYTYRISQDSNNIDAIFRGFHSNLKNDIKNALKEGVEVKQDISFEQFFDIINKTFLRQGGNSPFNKEKMKYFISAVKAKGKFISFGAYNSSGICIAVCGLVYDEYSSYLILNGIDIEKQIRGANAVILYESIKYFHNKCKIYDFEGSMLPGVEQFYRRFGGELTPYMRIWNDNFFNYAKSKAKQIYKKIRYER